MKQTDGQPLKLETQVLFIAPFDSGPDTGENIRRIPKNTLYFTVSIDFEMVMQSFTVVFDFAAVMPTVVESSASTARNRWVEPWSPCIEHMLNTATKLAIAEAEKSNKVHAIQMIKD